MFTLDFPGGSNQQPRVEFADKKPAKLIGQCEELDGQALCTYASQNGAACAVSPTLVNGLFAQGREVRLRCHRSLLMLT